VGRFHPVRTLLRIDRGALRAVLYRGGRPVWRARIGVGTPANPTPAGRYYVRSRILPIDRSGPYGAFAFGTSAFSPGLSDWPGGGIVGIHGTDQPQLLPGRVSHGCVRVRNRDITRLRTLMPLGTPIEVV
jgi:lipoprotein-anchoring transpeptidase ErfK/SrfK